MAKITYQDLTNMARSGDPNERKRGFGLFEAWVRVAPKLQNAERLTQMEREVLTQLFEQKGLITAERQRQIAAKRKLR
jgi:hypothetical protein